MVFTNQLLRNTGTCLDSKCIVTTLFKLTSTLMIWYTLHTIDKHANSLTPEDGNILNTYPLGDER